MLTILDVINSNKIFSVVKRENKVYINNEENIAIAIFDIIYIDNDSVLLKNGNKTSAITTQIFYFLFVKNINNIDVEKTYSSTRRTKYILGHYTDFLLKDILDG